MITKEKNSQSSSTVLMPKMNLNVHLRDKCFFFYHNHLQFLNIQRLFDSKMISKWPSVWHILDMPLWCWACNKNSYIFNRDIILICVNLVWNKFQSTFLEYQPNSIKILQFTLTNHLRMQIINSAKPHSNWVFDWVKFW